MEKGRKKTIVAVAIILVLVVVGVLYFNLTKIEIPEGCNLMVKIDWQSAPSNIETYYFYDDYIIETNSSSGVLPEGVVTHTTTTKYHFNEKIDLTELETFIEKTPKATFATVEIVDKNGNSYYIDDRSNSTQENNNLIIAHQELLEKIWKITEKASSKQVRKN